MTPVFVKEFIFNRKAYRFNRRLRKMFGRFFLGHELGQVLYDLTEQNLTMDELKIVYPEIMKKIGLQTDLSMQKILSGSIDREKSLMVLFHFKQVLPKHIYEYNLVYGFLQKLITPKFINYCRNHNYYTPANLGDAHAVEIEFKESLYHNTVQIINNPYLFEVYKSEQVTEKLSAIPELLHLRSEPLKEYVDVLEALCPDYEKIIISIFDQQILVLTNSALRRKMNI